MTRRLEQTICRISVLKALRANGLNVVAIHHHMTATQPTVYFLHYWGTGPAEKLADGFRAALNELGKGKGGGKVGGAAVQ
jgi:hypothetical protein